MKAKMQLFNVTALSLSVTFCLLSAFSNKYKRLLIFFLFLCTKKKYNEKLFCFFNVKNKEKQQFFISFFCLTLIHYEEFLFYAFSYASMCMSKDVDRIFRGHGRNVHSSFKNVITCLIKILKIKEEK